MNLRRILAIVRLDACAQPCIDRAMALAEATGAALNLVSIVYDPAGADDLFHWGDADHMAARKADLAEARSELRRLATDHGLDPACVDVSWGHPFDEAVAAAATAHRADLVMLQPRDPSKTRLSTAEWRLLRECPVPIWLVRSRRWPGKPRILAAVDPLPELGELDRAILRAAGGAGRASHARVEVVNACDETPGIVEIAQDVEDYEREFETLRRDAIRKLLPAGSVVDPPIRVVPAEPVDALLQLCGEGGVALVVIGVHTRQTLKDRLIGSTARRFIPHTVCDVMLVPTHDHV